MANRIVTIFFHALIVAMCVAGATAQSPGGLVWQVQSYDIDATMPADNARSAVMRAGLNIKNISGSSASTLTLRISQQAEITGVAVNGGKVDFTKGEEKTSGSNSLQRLSIRIPAVASGGNFSVTVDYKFTVKENSGLEAISPVGSQFLPLSFWYPTPTSWFFARGADTAPFKVKVTAPNGMTVASSGVASAGGFDQKISGQPFFAAGYWTAIDSAGVKVFAPTGGDPEIQKRAVDLASILNEARTFTATYLGPIPDAPARIVAVRRGAGFGGGGTVLVDEAVFRRPKVDSQTAMNLAEAAVKTWLGGSVAVNGDGYGIISEGLTRYIATQFIESKFGKEAADVERVRQRSAYISVSKRGLPMGTASPIDDSYFGEVANKGAMMFRIVSQRIGATAFAAAMKSAAEDHSITVAELRTVFAEQSDLLTAFLDKATDMNLMAGLPQALNGETKVALRNSGTIDATVNVRATTASGKMLDVPVTIKALSFGEVSFKTPEKVVSVEVDVEKLYPQIEYFDDISPRGLTESDPVLAAKKPFDKQDFAGGETAARLALRTYPRFDEVRVLLGRALLGAGRAAEAEKEFKAVLDEPLPTARSMAWADEGLAEVAAKGGQNDAAIKLVETTIGLDADYGASYAARKLRTRLNGTTTVDPAVKAFFTEFDRAATANRKADIDVLVMPGEVVKFAAGVAGSTEKWQTVVKQVDAVGPDQILVEVGLTEKLLNKDEETGTAVYRLRKVAGAWKLTGVEIFEVG